jgi:hypothetical protein
MEAAQLSIVLVDDAPHHGSLQDQIGGSEVPRPSHESQHCRGERVRRVCHHPEWSPWCDEILQVTLEDRGVAVDHLLPEPACPSGVQLDSDNSRASIEERQSKGTGAGTQVDDQIARPDGRASNDSLSPVRIQPVPAPWPPP